MFNIFNFHYKRISESRSVVSDSLQPNGLYSPWNSPGQNTGMCSLYLLQGIFPTQGSNLCLLHCRWILCLLSHWGILAYNMHLWHSVQFSHSVVSDSLPPKEPQHARSPCPSPTPRVYPNSCPLSWWCHPTISSSVVPFSSCPQSFPASGSFPMSHLFTSDDQSIGVSATTSVLPMNTPDWSPLGWTGWTSSQSKGVSKSRLQHHSSKAPILRCSAFFTFQLSHPYMTTGKTIALTRWTFVGNNCTIL